MPQREKIFFKYSGTTPERDDGLYWRNKNGDRHFPVTPYCPYCKMHAKGVYRNSRTLSSPPEDSDQWYTEYTVAVYICENCGWWYVVDQEDNHDMDSDGSPWSCMKYQRAILEVHDLSNPDIAIDALEAEIKKRKDRIHQIHPGAMERLVAGVMRDFYPASEVEHCGRSGDGGIDLYLTKGDKVIGVQVKRRASPNKVENVSTIRDFFGAGMAKDLKDLIFVSTAKRFSGTPTGAKKFAEDVVLGRRIDSFELFNRDRFLRMLDVVVDAPLPEPWKNFVW